MSRHIDGRVAVLDEAGMRALGFTDHREGFWYFCKRVGSGETMNFTVDKSTGDYEELVMDEYFGQPAFYGRMKPEYGRPIMAAVDAIVLAMNEAGLAFAVDHSQYGVADALKD